MTTNRHAPSQWGGWSLCFGDLRFGFSYVGGLNHELGDVSEQSALAAGNWIRLRKGGSWNFAGKDWRRGVVEQKDGMPGCGASFTNHDNIKI
jgi:hypothetical protein